TGVDAKLRTCRLRIGLQALLERGIYPRPSDQPRPVRRRARIHVVDLALHVVAAEHTLFDQQIADSVDALTVERHLVALRRLGIVLSHIVRVPVLTVRMVMLCAHWPLPVPSAESAGTNQPP